jgi:hypothetical protein
MANPLALKALRLAGKGIKSVVKKLKSKKKDGLNSFKNLKQKRDYLKETSPMGRIEKNWPLKVPKETKYLHKKMDATAKKYGDGKQFYRPKSGVGGGRNNMSNEAWINPSNRSNQAIEKLSLKGKQKVLTDGWKIQRGKKPKTVAGLAPVAGMPDRSNVKNKSSNMKINLKKVK